MLIDIKRKLLHKVNVTGISTLSGYGEAQAGTVVNSVFCFVSGTKSRMVGGQGEEVQLDYKVLFDRDTDINVGYVLTNAVDQFGNALFDRMIVKQYVPQIHREDGILAKEVSVTRGG